jgi:hypothetical protein
MTPRKRPKRLARKSELDSNLLAVFRCKSCIVHRHRLWQSAFGGLRIPRSQSRSGANLNIGNRTLTHNLVQAHSSSEQIKTLTDNDNLHKTTRIRQYRETKLIAPSVLANTHFVTYSRPIVRGSFDRHLYKVSWGYNPGQKVKLPYRANQRRLRVGKTTRNEYPAKKFKKAIQLNGFEKSVELYAPK